MVSRPPPLPPVRGLEPVSLTAWEGRVTAVIQLQVLEVQDVDIEQLYGIGYGFN